MNSGTADWISGPKIAPRRSGRSLSRTIASGGATAGSLVGVEHRLDFGGIDVERRDAGAFDLEQPADAAVALAPAAVHRLGQLLEREVGEAHRHRHLPAEPDRERDVLVQQAQGEIGRVVLRAEELAEPVEGALAAGRALAHRLPQFERVDP